MFIYIKMDNTSRKQYFHERYELMKKVKKGEIEMPPRKKKHQTEEEKIRALRESQKRYMQRLIQSYNINKTQIQTN